MKKAAGAATGDGQTKAKGERENEAGRDRQEKNDAV